MRQIEALQSEFKTSLKKSLNIVDALSWSEDSVGINVVFGISDLGLPARFLAGFTPAFSLAEAIGEVKHVTPELRVFIPLHLAVRANGVSTDHAEKTARQGVVFVQKFQEIFHPQVSWFLDRDVPMSDDSVNFLVSLSDQLLTIEEPALRASWEKAFLSAERRGNADNARIYTPHHAFGWHDAWDPFRFFPAQAKRVTLNCFSTSEETFQPIRRTVASILNAQQPELVVHGNHLDLFTDRCPGPHYLPRTINGIHEPLLGDLLSLGFDRTRKELAQMVSDGFHTALKDLDAINAHIEKRRHHDPTLPNIDDFIEEIRDVRIEESI